MKLLPRCSHVWGLGTGSCYGPVTSPFHTWGNWRHLVHGFTIVRQTCTKCSRVRSYQVTGKVDFPVLASLDVVPVHRSVFALLFGRCPHDFGPAAGTFSPPPGRPARLTGMVSLADVSVLTQGISTLTHACRHCHLLQSWNTLGQADISVINAPVERTSVAI